MTEHKPSSSTLVSAAEIARIAGVTRAAVSNWRRRYDDFPAPAAGSGTSPLFDLAAIHRWMAAQGKGQELSAEVLLWQDLRRAYEDDMVSGLADVAAYCTGGRTGLSAALRERVDALVSEGDARLAVDGLVARYTESVGRSGSDSASSARLIRAFRHFTRKAKGVAFDPACGIGALLLAVGGLEIRNRVGQEIDPAKAWLAERWAYVHGASKAAVAAGDSLRDDRHRGLRADLVVCDPPVGVTDWGREELLLDARWELGVPSRAEGELAWLQHCYFHTAPGGTAVVAMSPSTAYRKAGRRIRAELVRRGVLEHVVALPPGTAAAHALPVHLWLLRRPPADATTKAAESVRMTDLTANEPDAPLEARPDQVADVPLIDLLDDTVDLTPARHITPARTDYNHAYSTARLALERRLGELQGRLPVLTEGSDGFHGGTVRVADLARAGLVDLSGKEPQSTSDQLDTDYLRGFLRSATNTRRSTSATGTFRADARGARLPQMDIGEQQSYGAAFRALDEVESEITEILDLARQAVALARDGLTSGALSPQAEPADQD
ncbi:N-6 DNA methylase [Streptomyces fractus]|uniref:N-6 DNA methylase n=1 Tax=Streptomyces fractus TaxID=641806 RepID=UPI003CE9729E